MCKDIDYAFVYFNSEISVYREGEGNNWRVFSICENICIGSEIA